MEKVMGQFRSDRFDELELTEKSRLMIHRPIHRSTVMYGSDSRVNSNN